MYVCGVICLRDNLQRIASDWGDFFNESDTYETHLANNSRLQITRDAPNYAVQFCSFYNLKPDGAIRITPVQNGKLLCEDCIFNLCGYIGTATYGGCLMFGTWGQIVQNRLGFLNAVGNKQGTASYSYINYNTPKEVPNYFILCTISNCGTADQSMNNLHIYGGIYNFSNSNISTSHCIKYAAISSNYLYQGAKLIYLNIFNNTCNTSVTGSNLIFFTGILNGAVLPLTYSNFIKNFCSSLFYAVNLISTFNHCSIFENTAALIFECGGSTNITVSETYCDNYTYKAAGTNTITFTEKILEFWSATAPTEVNEFCLQVRTLTFNDNEDTDLPQNSVYHVYECQLFMMTIY